jgi:hypothetical protein
MGAACCGPTALADPDPDPDREDQWHIALSLADPDESGPVAHMKELSLLGRRASPRFPASPRLRRTSRPAEASSATLALPGGEGIGHPDLSGPCPYGRLSWRARDSCSWGDSDTWASCFARATQDKEAHGTCGRMAGWLIWRARPAGRRVRGSWA